MLIRNETAYFLHYVSYTSTLSQIRINKQYNLYTIVGRNSENMNENTHRVWDILFKFLVGIGAIISFLYGAEKFEISSRREFAKEFYKEEIVFYNRLVSTTSSLANSTISDSTKQPIFREFDIIYNGQKDYYVADDELLDYIRKFNDAVTFMKNGEMVFSENQSTYERARKYANLIGNQSRKNIDKIIYQVKKDENE